MALHRTQPQRVCQGHHMSEPLGDKCLVSHFLKHLPFRRAPGLEKIKENMKIWDRVNGMNIQIGPRYACKLCDRHRGLQALSRK